MIIAVDGPTASGKGTIARALARHFGLPHLDTGLLYRAVGCPRCDFQGYRGRTAIMELVRMDGDMDELLARRASQREIRNAARAKGFRALAEDGARRVLDGITSLDELTRVVDLTERMV